MKTDTSLQSGILTIPSLVIHLFINTENKSCNYKQELASDTKNRIEYYNNHVKRGCGRTKHFPYHRENNADKQDIPPVIFHKITHSLAQVWVQILIVSIVPVQTGFTNILFERTEISAQNTRSDSIHF